jgi:5-bromo-4-chloroindolyl phosphate hydrolysis protein
MAQLKELNQTDRWAFQTVYEKLGSAQYNLVLALGNEWTINARNNLEHARSKIMEALKALDAADACVATEKEREIVAPN